MADRRHSEDSGSRGFNPRSIIAWVVIGICLMVLYQVRRHQNHGAKTLNFSELMTKFNAGEIESITFTEGEVSARGTLKGEEGKEIPFRTDIPLSEGTRSAMEKSFVDGGVQVNVKSSNTFWKTLAASLLPLLAVILLVWYVISRQMRGIGRGAMSFGKSRAKLMSTERVKVTFRDVAGVDEAEEELEEIIDFLKDPKKFQRLGGRIPKGVLLVGPPGTGKTLLAKAIAGEADVPFFSISGSDFVEMFVGVGASRVRDMFEQGKRNAPSIIFIDEIDAVGRHRGAGIGGGHDEREQTLNQLLAEMDGFNTQEGVIIIAATNRPDVLDPALLRPGRFDRQVVIDLPDLEGREAILKVHARNVVLSKKVNLRKIARGTPGFSGAELANLVNEAALLAARGNKKSVGMRDLEEARDKVRWGRERRSRILDEKEKRVTAYHEAGHALVLEMIPDTEPLHKVTIIPRGIAYLGATLQLPEKDKYLESRKELLGQIAGLMGGRVAEEITFGDITAGARSDIKTATKIARMMVCEWGMSGLGPMTFGNREEHIFLGREISRTVDYSEATAVKIDAEIRRIIEEGYSRAREIILNNEDVLVQVAEALLEREVLEGEEVGRIVRGEVLPPPRARKRARPGARDKGAVAS